MEQKLSKRNKIILVIVTISLLAVFSVLTYAYFTANGVSNNATESNVVALTSNYGNVIVNYKDGNRINSEDVVLVQGEGDSKSILKFAIQNTGTISHELIIFWRDLVNNFCMYERAGECTNIESDNDVRNELNYTLYQCSNLENYESATIDSLDGCTAISGENETVPATGSMNNMHTAENILINREEVLYYVFMLTIENLDVAQDYNEQKNMSGRIYVDFFGVDVSGYLRNEENNILANYEMTINSDPVTTTTDENGYFYFKNVQKGNHTLVVKNNENVSVASKPIEIKEGASNSIDADILTVAGAEINTFIYLEPQGPIFSKEKRIVSISVSGGEANEGVILLTEDEIKNLTITPNSGYGFDNASVVCTSGINNTFNNGMLTISNVTTTGTCNISLELNSVLLSAAIQDKYPPQNDNAITFSYTSAGCNSESACNAGTVVSAAQVTNGLYINSKSNIANDPTQGQIKYFRGDVDNYVSFAGMLWRVILINADNSIKLITENTPLSSSVNPCLQTPAGSATPKYVAYTYDDNNSSRTDGNMGTSSVLKNTLDNWYNSNLSSYSNHIKQDASFCNEVSYTPILEANVNIYINTFITNTRLKNQYAPTHSCSSTNYTFGGVYNLPIATLTADELVYAGAAMSRRNSSYYLYNGTNFWLLSPFSNFQDQNRNENNVIFSSDISYGLNADVGSQGKGVRPVIVLKPGTLVTVNGVGTQDNPWVVQ